MPFSPDVVTRTVFGEYLQVGGAPAKGQIVFEASSKIRDSLDSIVLQAPIIIQFDINGRFTVDLPTTDNPLLSPEGWYYYCRVRQSGAKPQSFRFYLDAGDLSDVDITLLDQADQFSNRQVGSRELPGPQGPRGYSGTQPVFSRPGPLAPMDGDTSFPIDRPGLIATTRAFVKTPPIGSPIVVDIKKNGVSIFATNTDKPTILPGQNTDLGNPSTTALIPGDYIDVSIDSVGSTFPGAGLTVSVTIE